MNVKVGDYVKIADFPKIGDLYYGTVSEIGGNVIYVDVVISEEAGAINVARYEYELEVVHRAEVSS